MELSRSHCSCCHLSRARLTRSSAKSNWAKLNGARVPKIYWLAVIQSHQVHNQQCCEKEEAQHSVWTLAGEAKAVFVPRCRVNMLTPNVQPCFLIWGSMGIYWLLKSALSGYSREAAVFKVYVLPHFVKTQTTTNCLLCPSALQWFAAYCFKNLQYWKQKRHSFYQARKRTVQENLATEMFLWERPKLSYSS